MRAIWVDSDTTFELRKLRNTLFNTIDETANVELTLQELDTTPVTGESWPKVLQGVGEGRYVFTLGTSMDVLPDTHYIAHFNVVGTSGEKAEWDIEVQAKLRTG